MAFEIPYLNHLDPGNLSGTSRLLDALPAREIGNNNWAGDYPYAPQVQLRLAHNGSYLFLKFKVNEEYTMARIKEDNGDVWTDSCVEFFLALDDSGYYNFEFTCIGKALLGFRKERPHAIHGSVDVMNSIFRYSTLGNVPFEEKQGNNHWELTVAIPASALFRHRLTVWNGVRATANAYKCGDHLSKPHFLSWHPIDTPQPDFHVARCFQDVVFQS